MFSITDRIKISIEEIVKSQNYINMLYANHKNLISIKFKDEFSEAFENISDDDVFNMSEIVDYKHFNGEYKLVGYQPKTNNYIISSLDNMQILYDVGSNKIMFDILKNLYNENPINTNLEIQEYETYYTLKNFYDIMFIYKHNLAKMIQNFPH
jgi:hypothetical protein